MRTASLLGIWAFFLCTNAISQEINNPLHWALDAVDQAVAKDDFEGAIKLLKAIKRQKPHENRWINARAQSLEELAKAFETQVRPALQKIETDSDDKEARLLVGKFYCLQKGDWKAVLSTSQKVRMWT